MDSGDTHGFVLLFEFFALLNLTAFGYCVIPLSYLPEYPHHVFGICMSALGLVVHIMVHLNELKKVPERNRGRYLCAHMIMPIVVRIGTWAWATYIYAQKLDASDRELRSQVSWHNDVWAQVLLHGLVNGIFTSIIQGCCGMKEKGTLLP